MVGCEVYGCESHSSRKELGVTFHRLNRMVLVCCSMKECYLGQSSSRHRFPNPKKDMGRFIKWVMLCGNKELAERPVEAVYSNCRVCADHFLPSDFGRNNVLLNTAIPSLMLPAPLTNIIPFDDHEPTAGPSGLPGKSRLPEKSFGPEDYITIGHPSLEPTRLSQQLQLTPEATYFKRHAGLSLTTRPNFAGKFTSQRFQKVSSKMDRISEEAQEENYNRKPKRYRSIKTTTDVSTKFANKEVVTEFVFQDCEIKNEELNVKEEHLADDAISIISYKSDQENLKGSHKHEGYMCDYQADQKETLYGPLPTQENLQEEVSMHRDSEEPSTIELALPRKGYHHQHLEVSYKPY